MLTKSWVVATKNGLMEYAMIGDGPVVMAVHGMPGGGFDQGIFGFDWIANAGFRLLAQTPFRIGHLVCTTHLLLIGKDPRYKLSLSWVENDIAQFTRLNDLPLEKITCPTLIVHGTHDNLLFYQAVQARDRIQQAKSLWVDKGSHFNAWIHPDASKTQEEIISFLQQHA